MAENVDKSIESVNEMTGSVDQPAPETTKRGPGRPKKSQDIDSKSTLPAAVSVGAMQSDPPRPKTRPHRDSPYESHREIDIDTLWHESRVLMIPSTQLAGKYGCSISNINSRLSKYSHDNQRIENYGKSRHKAFLKLQQQILSTLDATKIKKLTPHQSIIAIGILEDKINQITQIKQVGNVFNAVIQAAHDVAMLARGSAVSSTPAVDDRHQAVIEGSVSIDTESCNEQEVA